MKRGNVGTMERWTGMVVMGLSIIPSFHLAAQTPFPTRPPTPTPLRPVQFPPFQEAALPNGMTLLLIENHEQPSLSVTLSFRAGSAYDPAGKEGLSAMVAELLTKGTPTRSADQIAATIEGVGGSLAASTGDDFFTVATDVLSDHADLAFELLGDVTRRATFPADEVELARTRFLSSLEVELSQPENVAARVFAKEIYGRNPYGRSASPASYKAITRDAPATPAPPAAPVKRGTDIVLVHRPGSVQSNIVMGNTTFLPADTGYYAARIATQVLGGGADARLFMILREQKSWTYGSYAALDRNRGLGHWEATFEGRTAVTDSALQEMLHQIDRMRNDPIPDSELGAAKGFLIGSFPLTIETPRQIARVVTTARLLGLGPDYLPRYRERLAGVGAIRARAAARRVYRRDGLTIVVVGDAKEIYDRLKTIAPVRLVDVDGNPMSPADLNPTGEPVAFDHSQIVARTDSFQAVVQGNPFGAQVTAVQVAGDSIVFTEATTLGPVVQQRTTVVLSAADLAMRRSDQSGTVQGQQSEIHLAYANGRVKGSAIVPQAAGTPKTVAIDTTVPAGAIDDNVLSLLAAALPLAEGKSFSLNVFSSGEGVTKVATIKVTGVENVTVPAGTFSAYRLEISGMQLPVVMHVSTESPRRMLRVAPVGAPLVFQLVK